jgi:hypothetical protein
MQACADMDALDVLQVIGKGVPEDAMQGIADKQVPLPDTMMNFQYMYNSTGSKVGLGYTCRIFKMSLCAVEALIWMLQPLVSLLLFTLGVARP